MNMEAFDVAPAYPIPNYYPGKYAKNATNWKKKFLRWKFINTTFRLILKKNIGCRVVTDHYLMLN